MQKVPWGFHIGHYVRTNDPDEIPVILKSDNGGLFLYYHENDQSLAENFLENIILSCVASLPLGMMHIHLWDYSIRKRFPTLVNFKKHGILHLAQDSDSADHAFEEILTLCRYRHHELLTNENNNLFLFNQRVNPPPRTISFSYY